MRALVMVGALVVGLVFVTSAMPSRAQRPSTIAARGSAYGRILFDGRGFALYAFTKDAAGRSTCARACAKKWPPYIVTGTPHAGRAVRPGLLGTIRRSDGSRQVTYAGKPLYHYTGDRKPL